MDAKEFREFGKAAVDFVADYYENIRDYDVVPSVEPGYMLNLLPNQMPEKAEPWRDIMEDIHRVVIPGITHWQSPNMHGYYPAGVSYPSIVGEMMASGFNIIGFSWICSPAVTELEVVVMDWLAKFLRLPAHFLHATEGPGGGVIQGSASESILVAALAAREQAVRRVLLERPELSESEVRGKLVAYSSDQSNSCVEKTGLLAAMPMRLLPAADDFIMYGAALQAAIELDLAAGLIPVICVATLGTTGTCAYDDIESLGVVCEQHQVWLHVDAAYAGGALALDECAELRRGLERVDSLNFNLHKFMLVNFDCTAMWLRDANKVVDSFNVDRIYLKHKYEGQSQIPDFRHWQIPLGRRFRSLKVWITFRTLGADGIRAHMRKHIDLASQFEALVKADERFELVVPRVLGLVCFRVKGDNEITSQLQSRLMEHKKIYIIKAEHGGRQFLRFAVCGIDPKPSDIDFAWTEITEQLVALLAAEPLLSGKKISDASKLSQQLAAGLQLTNGTNEKIL